MGYGQQTLAVGSHCWFMGRRDTGLISTRQTGIASFLHTLHLFTPKTPAFYSQGKRDLACRHTFALL
jgi:hypothetical protein